MIDTIKAVVILASLAIMIIPFLLIKSLNTKKNVRYKQLRYPCVAAIFSVAAVILLSFFGDLIDRLINLEIVQKLLNWLSPQGKLDYVVLLYTAIIVNALLLFAFFFVKSLARICIGKKKLPTEQEKCSWASRLYWRVVSVFYDLGSGKITLHRDWVKIRHTLKYASWILTAIYLLFMLFLQFPVFMSYSWIPYDFMQSCVKTLYIWPTVSLILINEFRWFLEGNEEFSKSAKMVFDHSERHSSSDYSELVNQYAEQFPERFAGYVRVEAKGESTNFYNDVRPDTKLEKAVADQLKKRGYTINTGFLACIKHLADGENALIDASLFSGFGEYLFLYLNTLLAHGDNVLFLCADDEAADNCKRYISDKLDKLNDLRGLWIVKGNEHGLSDADVLVLTPQFVFDSNLFAARGRFFAKLSTVIVVNSAEVIAKDGIALGLAAHKLASMLRGDGMRSLRYICLSESVPPETVNALKQVLNLKENMYVCDGYQSFDNTHLMLWNYEPCSDVEADDSGKTTLAQDNLFEGSYRTYWGVALPMACVGMKYDVKKIAVISHSGTPYLQIINSIKRQSSRILNSLSFELESDAFDETIVFNRGDSDDPHAAFIIAEDDLYNLPLAMRNYCRYGGTDTTMIHIISKPYMLRDFFAANAEMYVNNDSGINMIMPALSDTRQIVVAKLLSEALEGGIEESDLYQRIRALDPAVQSVDQALELCCDIIFPERNGRPLEYYFSFKKVKVFNAETVSDEEKRLICLKRDTPLTTVLHNSKPAVMELRGERFVMGVFAEHLYQHFAPTQSFAFRGNLYTIDSIDLEAGVVHVREASDTLDSPVDYVEVRTYEVKQCGAPDAPIAALYDSGEGRLSSGYEITVYKHAEISVDTAGYYALDPHTAKLDLCKGPSFKPMADADIQRAHRDYADANMISFKIKGVGADRSDKAAFLLAVMMNEMMKTIFPYSHDCISVCPVLSDKESVYGDAMGSKIKNAYPQAVIADYDHDKNDIEVLIIEDSITDIGMTRTLLQNEQYPFAVFFETITSYLAWFNAFEYSGNISKKYLFFGADEMPSCFDAETLYAVCAEFETVKRRGPIKVEKLASKCRCSYCYRELFNVDYVEVKDNAGGNNRKLCSKCAELIVSDEDTLRAIYKEVRAYLCNSFAIQLPDDINVRFATAEKIRKKLKTGDQRVVLGFANNKTREIWVEADAPAPNVKCTLAHELTHMWQFENIEMSDLVYIEGHSSYIEVQYMRYEHRKVFANWLEQSFNSRQDEYGEGFRRIKADLEANGDYNSFAYMAERFGKGTSAAD